MSDTPESDNFEKHFPDAPVSGWKRIARRFERERDELRRWKAEALSVMPPYQEIGQEIGVTIGQAIHDKILPELIRRRGEIERLRQALRSPHPASPGYSSGDDNPSPRIFGG